jgi:hypothetical protein
MQLLLKRKPFAQSPPESETIGVAASSAAFTASSPIIFSKAFDITPPLFEALDLNSGPSIF